MNPNVKQIVIVSVICAIILGLVLGLVFFFKKKKKNGGGPPGQYIGVINKVAEPFHVVWLYGGPIGPTGNNTPKLLRAASDCQSIEWASSSDLYNAWGTVGNGNGTYARWALSDASRPISITHITHGGGTKSYQNLDAYQNHIWKGDPSKSGMYQMVVSLVQGTKMSGPHSGQSGYAGLCDDCKQGNTSMLITILDSEWVKFKNWVPTIPNLSIGASQLVCNSTPAGIWYGDGYDTTTLPQGLDWSSTNDVQKVAKTINFNKDSLIEAGLYYTLDTSGNITPKTSIPFATNIVNFQSNLPAQCNSAPAGTYAWVTGSQDAFTEAQNLVGGNGYYSWNVNVTT